MFTGGTVESPKFHFFICTSSRAGGEQKGFCHSKDANNLLQKFVEVIDENGFSGDCMVTNTGCFGLCDKGPVVVVYPQGIWYGNVTMVDVEDIVLSHFDKNEPLARLRI
jgi:(2Fe-2S) ferredoxin